MIATANELESLLLKAVRGAGLSWGLAEEAAAAGVWLARADLLQVEPFVARLEAERKSSPPVSVGHAIEPVVPGTSLCPILTGAWIADQGSASQCLTIKRVLSPIWLAAVVARALPRGDQLTVEWDGVRLMLDQAGPLEPIHNVSLRLAAVATDAVRLTGQCMARLRTAPPRAPSGIIVPDRDWQALQTFEQLTYVPASDRSRLSGAGAGLLDGD